MSEKKNSLRRLHSFWLSKWFLCWLALSSRLVNESPVNTEKRISYCFSERRFEGEDLTNWLEPLIICQKKAKTNMSPVWRITEFFGRNYRMGFAIRSDVRNLWQRKPWVVLCADHNRRHLFLRENVKETWVLTRIERESTCILIISKIVRIRKECELTLFNKLKQSCQQPRKTKLWEVILVLILFHYIYRKISVLHWRLVFLKYDERLQTGFFWDQSYILV